MGSSKLLINEPPLQVLPTLAEKLGVNQAIILQQIHYWLIHSEHDIEGHVWVYNTYKEWAEQFKWLKPRAIQKHIIQLEKAGYLIPGNFNKMRNDHTKWYRIDYDKLNAEGEILHSECKKVTSAVKKVTPAVKNFTNVGEESSHLTIDYQENTTKTTTESNGNKPSPNDVKRVFQSIHDYYGFPDKTKIDPIPNYGKEGKAIKRMLDRGLEVEQIITCWLEKTQKAGLYKSMVYVNEDIGDRPPKVEDIDRVSSGQSVETAILIARGDMPASATNRRLLQNELDSKGISYD